MWFHKISNNVGKIKLKSFRIEHKFIHVLVLTLRPGLRHMTLIAFGTTRRFLLSNGAGQPSYALSLRRACFPLSVLCGTIPKFKK